MNILDKIIADKTKEVQLKKELISIENLKHFPPFQRERISLKNRLTQSKTGIIAEFKRRSPSKSIINQTANIWDVALGYENASVCGISVLTDGKYFGGSLDDLLLARATVSTPLLRKDFVINEFQLYEAKAFGADVILLIAAILSKNELNNLAECARNLNLEILLEIHNEDELEKSIDADPDFIGVNNRNLKTFDVSIENSIYLADKIPDKFIKISESGLSNPENIITLQQHGYQGFLIGENFMKTDNPEKYATEFIQKIKR